jgi:hypothetical protein
MMQQKNKNHGKYITIYIRLINPKGKQIDGTVIIKDGMSAFYCEDKKLPKKLYTIEKRKGEDVAYNFVHKAFVKRYKDKTKEEIRDILKKELEAQGGDITEEKTS